jgi:hypothetical protein
MAFAAPTMTVRDLPVHATRTLAAARPAFNMVAFHWRGAGGVQYRVRFTHGWGSWHAADGDLGTEEGWHLGNLDWVGKATALQTRIVGTIGRLRSYTIWSPVDTTAQRRLQIANAPPIIPRLSWGADESIRRAPPRYAPKLQLAFVHHTDGSNNYTRAQSAAIVRGIEIYHVKGNGWDDIGYNFLVDKYGQVFEGRYGGVDRNVIGAHVEGFNTGSVGVAVLGTYTGTKISPAAATALEQLLSWRLDLAHIDPLSTVTYASGGNSRFPAGTPVTLRTISGHRDAYFSDCPGNALYAQLPAIAKAVAALGGTKIYAPQVTKPDETDVRFTARLSTASPWTVTITDSTGAQVAQGTGAGPAVDWTWDTLAAPPDTYTWTIASGTARPVTGTLGATAALTLQKVAAVPQVVPPGGTITVQYTLTAPATVSAVLAETGQALVTVAKPAGAQTLAVALPAMLTAGSYSVQLTATSGTRAVTADAPFVLDDALTGFTVTNVGATVTLAKAPTAATLALLQGSSVVWQTVIPPAVGMQVVPWPLPAEGAYTVALTITDAAGTYTTNTPLTVDTTPPKVTVLSYANMRFRLSEPVTLTLVVGPQRYTRHVRKPATTQFWLKVKPVAYTLLATDGAGNVTRVRYRR